MVIRMVLAIWKHLQMTKVIILDNFDFKIFSKKIFPGHVRAQVLQEAFGGSHGDQDGPGCLKTPSDDQYNHPLHFVFQELSQKTNPWGCPGSGPPGTCWRLPW